jgi:hypothetical protein
MTYASVAAGSIQPSRPCVQPAAPRSAAAPGPAYGTTLTAAVSYQLDHDGSGASARLPRLAMMRVRTAGLSMDESKARRTPFGPNSGWASRWFSTTAVRLAQG